MPTEDDLTGLGVPAPLAAELGNQPVTITCAGTSQTTAAAIKSKLSTLSAAASQTGAILPSGAKIGSPFWAGCSTATSAVVYVPVGHTLNGSSNGSLTIAQNKMAVFMQFSPKNWYSMLTA